MNPEQPGNPTLGAVLLMDLSSLVHPIWHMSAKEPDRNYTSTKAVAEVRRFASKFPHVGICCDRGRSFRKDLDPTYKANRPEHEAPLIHQLKLTEEALQADGFPIFAENGFEADDVIASAASNLKYLAVPITIASSDKDLLQLVGRHRIIENGNTIGESVIDVLSLRTGQIIDAEAVEIKFGVQPSQMRDYLTLVGDTADNLKGVPGIGAKKAADLLRDFGSLDAIRKHAMDYPAGSDGKTMSKGLIFALRLAEPDLDAMRQLVTLRTDAPINFAPIFDPRTPAEGLDTMNDPIVDNIAETMTPLDNALTENRLDHPTPPTVPLVATISTGSVDAKPADANGKPSSAALTVLPPAGVQWDRELEPRNLEAARVVSKFLHESRFFSAYGSPQAIFAVVLAGRELGLGTMASLRGFHIVEGKPTMAADLMRSLVLRSGLADYFTCTERSAERATFVTRRKGDSHEVTLTYTIEEARQAGVSTKPGSGWQKNPSDMLVARSSGKLARLVYPDLLFGLYAPEEFDEV